MLNDPQTYQSVEEGMKSVLRLCNISSRHNAMYGTDDISNSMMGSSIRNKSVGGYANARKYAGMAGTPSDRWHANAIKGIKPEKIQAILEEKVSEQVHRLRELKKIPKKGMCVAIDMHLISRYDKHPTEEITRSKSKNGTTRFERYMTIQCVDDEARIVLGACYLNSGESVPKSMEYLLDSVHKMGIKIRMVLLDREFFSVDVIRCLGQRDVNFLIPCKNTYNVVAALREFSQGKRDNVSGNVLENSQESVRYTMMITDRKKRKKSDEAEEKYIGFATNRPSAKIEAYAKRWGIETGYRMIQGYRAKTRITDVGSRMLCFYFSLLMFNEWIIVRAMFCNGTKRCVVTMGAFMLHIEKTLPNPWPPP